MADVVTQPKTTAPVPVREERIKLRSACDRCSLNKIKCSQDKPECQRCKTIGAQCHYSRSMRMGKPRKSAKAKAMMSAKLPGKTEGEAARNNSSSSNEQQQQQQQHPGTASELAWPAEWNFDNLLDHMSVSSASGTPAPADPFKLLFDHHHHSNNSNNNSNIHRGSTATNASAIVPTADIIPVDALSAGYSHADDAFLSFPQSPLSIQKPFKDEPADNVYLSPSSYYAPSFESTLLSTGSSSPFEDLGPSLLSQPNAHDCTHLALETLTSLCQPSTLQRTGEGQPRPTIDQVLKMNSEAMKNVSTILSCTCAKDSSFPMLLSTIFSKALAWYRAAVPSNDAAALDSNVSDTVNCAREEIVHRPISVGGYELDDESSDLIRIQLVLNRLRMMAKPVKQYIEAYSPSVYGPRPLSPSSTQGSSPDIKPSNAALAGSMAEVYSTMGTFIQENLQSAIEDLQSKLVLIGGHVQ